MRRTSDLARRLYCGSVSGRKPAAPLASPLRGCAQGCAQVVLRPSPFSADRAPEKPDATGLGGAACVWWRGSTDLPSTRSPVRPRSPALSGSSRACGLLQPIPAPRPACRTRSRSRTLRRGRAVGEGREAGRRPRSTPHAARIRRHSSGRRLGDGSAHRRGPALLVLRRPSSRGGGCGGATRVIAAVASRQERL